MTAAPAVVSDQASIREELERIARSHGGLLKPEDVVEEARQPSSPLHSQFTWDNSEAAHHWRLFQARNLIRVVVVYHESPASESRVFVSLTPDRKEEGGGYRLLRTVLSNQQMRAQLLEDALHELQVFEDKYRHLKELARVFKAIKAVSKKKK